MVCELCNGIDKMHENTGKIGRMEKMRVKLRHTICVARPFYGCIFGENGEKEKCKP